MQMNRHHLLTAATLATLALAALPPTAAQAQEIKSIRIGYTLPRTGPLAAGTPSTRAFYQTWVKDVNDAGGIMLSSVGKKVPVEVIEYDDKSSPEEAAKLVERLATQDKVDLILAPWGTTLNVAAAPVFDRLGYPQLAVAAITDGAPEYIKKWPNSFWLQGTSKSFADNLVELLAKLRTEGKIGPAVAVVNMTEELGVEMARDAREALKKSGFNIVYDKTYALGSDMAPIVKEAMAANPDAFLAFSYPPDTIGLTDQAIAQKFNPKVFYTTIGASQPIYKQRFRENVDGVMALGGWGADLPEAKAFRKRYVDATGGEPDRSGFLQYVMLQLLQHAVEKVGKIDRAAISKELQTGTFDTIMGKIKLVDRALPSPWRISQWQGGEFYGVAPIDNAGVHQAIVPKPEWKSKTAAAQ